VRLGRLRNIQKINYEDEGYYIGQIEDGLKHGSGVLSIKDGSVYLGDWKEDNYHGEGIYIYPDGERFEGEL
jgi:hypothetical protein